MMKILNNKPKLSMDLTSDLYRSISSQSRKLVFYKDYQIPDTPQGRFEMLTLHMALILRRLKFLKPEEATTGPMISQHLCDWVVADIEESIRSMPVSDLKITRNLKKFMEGFYGRLIAYDKALELNDIGMLEEVIRRNVYGLVETIEDRIVQSLVGYTHQTWERLKSNNLSQIIIEFKGE